MVKMKSFNVNNMVMVKLTDAGRYIYYHQYDSVNIRAGRVVIEPAYPKEDEFGYYHDQLWGLFQTFGSAMKLGCVPPFSTEILISDEDIKEFHHQESNITKR